jgi:D-glycero-D-manno-heptose 1,7-bisphosphate phosphatase
MSSRKSKVLKMLVIIDKDGTLVEPWSFSQFIQNPRDQRLLPNVKERIAELKQIGATIAIASNQGGVASGHKLLESAIEEMRFCMSLLPEIQYGYFCPDFEGRQCYYLNSCLPTELIAYPAHSKPEAVELIGKFRKPDPGMLLLADMHHPSTKGDRIMVGCGSFRATILSRN